jgi:RNA-splicing ligase RtcB
MQSSALKSRGSPCGPRPATGSAIEAYKDVNAVIDVVHNAGLAKRVVPLKPIGVIKG